MTSDPSAVPRTFINDASRLPDLQSAIEHSVNLAIDTEVPIAGDRAGQLRVMSLAIRLADGREQAFVVDARDVAPELLAPLLVGKTADAWNASFDARVLDAAVWNSSDITSDLQWWDAQLGDALIHQGRSGFTWYHGLAWATGHYLGIEAEGKGTVQLSYTAFDDLTPEQVGYAAADAVETLWVADAIRAELDQAGLATIAEIEMSARPFLDQMERTGLPFDWPGWEAELGRIESENRQVVGELAALTGGGQGSLFDDVVEPNWNPGSDRQVREALNRYATKHVHDWTALRESKPRLLNDGDSVRAPILREIGGDLCGTLLRFRNQTKVLSTYGDSIRDHLDDDGRLRPQYLQVVGTNTGRLASRNPNAQNFTPLMKPYLTPPSPDRVFVYADLSQAELRFLAQVADDKPLREAFAQGVDVHVSTAASMFGFDPDQLLESDPARFKHLRQIAKALNFGIAYGTGASALSRSLTAEGSVTTVEEAAKLLAQYRRTYPGTAAWAEARIGEIQQVRELTPSIDWSLTMSLASGFTTVDSLRKGFRRSHNRWPSAAEVAEQHPDRLGAGDSDFVARVGWLMKYSAPVALEESGEPFTFASRTLSGRRQQFNLHLDRLFQLVASEAIQDRSPSSVRVRRRFEQENSVVVQSGDRPLDRNDLAKLFEDRALRRRYVETIQNELGEEVAHRHLDRAAKERVSVMVNAWRNAPIQGGVADIMLVAYADLERRLRRYSTARPVQTVHDSVAIECDRSDAKAVAQEVVEALEMASLRFCPGVVPKVDVDVRTSMADSDVVPGM